MTITIVNSAQQKQTFNATDKHTVRFIDDAFVDKTYIIITSYIKYSTLAAIEDYIKRCMDSEFKLEKIIIKNDENKEIQVVPWDMLDYNAHFLFSADWDLLNLQFGIRIQHIET